MPTRPRYSRFCYDPGMRWTLPLLLLAIGCAAVRNAQDDDRPGAQAPLARSDGSTAEDVSPGELTPVGDPGVPKIPQDIKATITDRPWRSSAKVKVCINKDGGIYKAEILKSTGRVDLDDSIIGTVRGWKYRPHLVKAKRTQACTTYLWTFAVE